MQPTTDAIKAFVKAQMAMGKAIKDTVNPHFKSKYADLGSVQDACFPALHANGFAVMQPNGVDESGEYVETQFLHESGGVFSTRIYLRISKADMQGYGSAITYARRYGLMNLAGIAPEDDDGNAAASHPPREATVRRQPAAEKTVSQEQKAIGWLGDAPDLKALEYRWMKLGHDKPDVAGDPDVEAAYRACKDRFEIPFPGDEVAA